MALGPAPPTSGGASAAADSAVAAASRNNARNMQRSPFPIPLARDTKHMRYEPCISKMSPGRLPNASARPIGNLMATPEIVPDSEHRGLAARLPDAVRQFALLARFDRPIGWWLLF